MKKTAENRYPHSATLFKFCKEALGLRYDGNVKVIDQDVGSILGYDPADCSHWKKGKKNIHALATIRSIADHLNLDERLLIDMASGRIGLEEGLFEFRGYGNFSMSGSNGETIRKNFFKNPEKWQSHSQSYSFEEIFRLNRQGVVLVALQILKAGRFNEAPVYLPEVYQMYSGLQMEKDAGLQQSLRVEKSGEGTGLQMTVFVGADEMRPYIRFLIARHLFLFLLESKNESVAELLDMPEEVRDIQANIFASALLVPGNLLHKEIEQVSSASDIVGQLAENFWVSRALMNQRLRDYMEYHY